MNHWHFPVNGNPDLLFRPKKFEPGVYACRVKDTDTSHKDVFLSWSEEGQWSCLETGRPFVGEVYGFVGPIPRTVG